MAIRDAAVLTIPQARRLGLLDAFLGVRSFDVGILIGAEHLSYHLIRLYLPFHPEMSQRFAYNDTKAWRQVEVELDTINLKFGERSCFTCPVSKKRCYKLFLYNGIACAKGVLADALAMMEYSAIKADEVETRIRSLGIGGTRLTSKNRTRFLAKASRLEGRDEEIDRRLRKERRRDAKYEERRLWESRPLSTTKAIDDGRGLNQHPSFRKMQHQSESWFSSVAPPVVLSPPSSEGLLTDYGELDIRILIERGVFDDPFSGKSIGWPAETTAGHYLSMFIRQRKDRLPQMIIEIENPEGEFFYQDVELMSRRDSTRPRHFLCPVERIRTDLLYFRNGFFASRTAHYLRYPPGGKQGVIRKMQSPVPNLSPKLPRLNSSMRERVAKLFRT